MDDIYTFAFLVSCIFIIFKIIVARFAESSDGTGAPLKIVLKDAVVVFFGVLLGHFIMGQLSGIGGGAGVNPQVFTDGPNF